MLSEAAKDNARKRLMELMQKVADASGDGTDAPDSKTIRLQFQRWDRFLSGGGSHITLCSPLAQQLQPHRRHHAPSVSHS